MRFRINLGLFALIALFWAPQAWALACATNVPPQIQVIAKQDPIQYNITITQAQLNARASGLLAASSAIHGSGGEVGGLTEGLINSQMQMEFATESQGGATCIRPSKIVVSIKYQPTILIANEYQRGSCNFKAVLQHEGKHVATDQNAIRKYIPIFQNTLASSAQGLLSANPVPTTATQEMSKRMQAMLGKTLDNVMKTLSAERETLQTNVDTPSEYARVQSLCSAW